jgi:hypothetical protein
MIRKLSIVVLLCGVVLAAAGCSPSSPGERSDSPPANSQSAQVAPVTPPQKTTAVKVPISPLISAQVSPSPKEATASQGEPPTLSNGAAKAIKLNGPIFDGWTKPKWSLLLSGRTSGYIEPCGCAGLENQKGGFSRRHTLIRQLQDKGWNLLALDAGGLVRRTGKQAQIKYERAISALKTMEYTAVGFGPADLRLPPEEVLAVIAPTDDGPGPIVSANVGLFGIDEKQTARYRMAKAGDVLIGITTVLAASQQKQFPADNIEYRDPSKALAEVLPKLKAAKCQRLVLMVYGTREEAVKLANEFPDFDLAVVSGDAETPPAQPTVLKDSDTLLIELGYKGMYVGVLGVYDNPKQPIRYQRVPLDARFEPSKAMHAMMVSYQKQLGELGWNGLGLKPVLHESGREFIGSETCADCHSSAHEVFEKTPHAHALKTLMKLDPPRHFDPECVSCHVTGWQTQQYFPYETGYLSVKKTPEMRANGCENCHGPGQRHALAEAEDIKVTKDERAKLRLDLRVTSKEARDGCLKCHDLDNSPDFHLSGAFEKYWKKVKHRGKD